MTNPFDPNNHDRGPLTSGLRIQDDKRSHLDRLNGPWPCGPAVLPAIELRENPLLAFAALMEDPDEADKQVAVAVKKHRGRKKKESVETIEAADATDTVDAEVIPASK